MPTETIGPTKVTDGEITSHDISQPDGQIEILSSQIRWQGVDVTEEETTTDTYPINPTNWESYENASNFGDSTQYGTSPEFPLDASSDCDNPDWDSHSGHLSGGTELADEDVRVVEARIYDSDNNVVAETLDTTFRLQDPALGPPVEVVQTDTQQLSSGASPPDVFILIDIDHADTTITESDLNLLDAGARTTWFCEETTTTTTTYSTQDPFVTRDVDGSYTGTLSDGEWSAWQNLSELDPNGVEEFYHNISGSGEAYFEAEYEWEYSYPEALKQLRIADKDSNSTYLVALADPADSLLDYNAVRVDVGGTTYAIDVVDPSDEDAIEWTHIYHPTHGALALRAYDTV